MDVLLLRLILDSSFFMAIFYPLIHERNSAVKWGLLAALAGWNIWLMVNWKKKDLEGIIHDITMKEVKILAVIQVYLLIILGFAEWQEVCAPFVTLFAVTAILFLRAGRLAGGSQEKKKFWGANGVEFAVLLTAAAVLSSDAVKAVGWKLLGGFYMKLIFPIFTALIYMVQLVLMVIGPWIAQFFSEVEFVDNGVEVDNRTGQDFLQLTGNEALVEVPAWAKLAGILLVAAGLGALLYFLYKKLSKGGSGRDRSIRGEIKKTSLAAADKTFLKKPSMFDEKNVRYYYRRFLEFCRKKDLWPESGMVTSEMMQTIVSERWDDRESMEAFTNLYRDVRYGGRNDGEPERATAKTLLKKIKAASEKKEK